MDEQEKRLKEIKAEITNLGDNLLWSDRNLKSAIVGEFEKTRSSINSIDSSYILLSTAKSVNSISLVAMDVRSIFRDVQKDVSAVSTSVSLTADLIQKSIKREESRSLREERAGLTSSTPELISRNQQITVTSDSGFSDVLGKKLGLVLDSASTFLKNWSNPVTVGTTLAIPIVAGIGAAFGGLYLVFGDTISKINNLIDNFASGIGKPISAIGAAIGTIGSSNSPNQPSNIQNDVFDVISKNVSLYGSKIEVSTSKSAELLSSIDRTVSRISQSDKSRATGISDTRISDAVRSADLSIVTAIRGLPLDRISDRIVSAIRENRNLASQTPIVIKTQGQTGSVNAEFDYSYQEKIVELLSAPISVKIDESLVRSDKNGELADVFSKAVSPLLASQNSMNRMLDSNLRRLSDAVATLKETPRVEDASRATRVQDNLNTAISDETITFILAETKSIRGIMTELKGDLESFMDAWKKSSSAKQSEQSRPIPLSAN